MGWKGAGEGAGRTAGGGTGPAEAGGGQGIAETAGEAMEAGVLKAPSLTKSAHWHLVSYIIVGGGNQVEAPPQLHLAFPPEDLGWPGPVSLCKCFARVSHLQPIFERSYLHKS